MTKPPTSGPAPDRHPDGGPTALMCWDIGPAPCGRYLHVRTIGRFNATDFKRLIDALLAHPVWVPGMPTLLDHRALDFSQTSFAEMLVAGGVHRQQDDRIGRSRAAIVLKDLADFGTAQMYDAVTRLHVQAQMQFFTDYAAALRWIEQVCDDAAPDAADPEHGHFAI